MSVEMIDKRLEELDKDYKNIIETINRMDQDKSNLITRGVSIRGAIDELQRMRAKLTAEESPREIVEPKKSDPEPTESKPEK